MLKLQNVRFNFPSFTLNDVSLEVKQNEVFTLLGPSGSGKSCILKAVAGVYTVHKGEIFLNERPIHHLPSEDRHIGLVFQNGALFDHLNVYDNIAFGLKILGYAKDEIKEKVQEYSELLQIEDLLYRSTINLSGGERQRIALARALVMQPEILLLDEPFSALDRLIREKLMVEFKRIFKAKKMTVLHVTHDQGEACIMADRIAVMQNGKVMQCDSPFELFHKPNSEFVASFLNIPNIFNGEVKAVNGKMEIQGDSINICCPSSEKINDKDDVVFCIRPEYVYLFKAQPDHLDHNIFSGVVSNKQYIESIIKITTQIDELEIVSVMTRNIDSNCNFEVGDKVFVHLPEQFVHVLKK